MHDKVKRTHRSCSVGVMVPRGTRGDGTPPRAAKAASANPHPRAQRLCAAPKMPPLKRQGAVFVAPMQMSLRHAANALIPRPHYSRGAIALSRVARVAQALFCRATQRQHRSAQAGAVRKRIGALRFAVRGAHGTDFHKTIIQTPARCHRRCV